MHHKKVFNRPLEFRWYLILFQNYTNFSIFFGALFGGILPKIHFDELSMFSTGFVVIPEDNRFRKFKKKLSARFWAIWAQTFAEANFDKISGLRVF